MEIAFEALENANIPISKIKGSDMGVFVAGGMDEGYIKLLFADKGWGGLWLASGFFIHEACDGMKVLDAQHTNETKRSMIASAIIALKQDSDCWFGRCWRSPVTRYVVTWIMTAQACTTLSTCDRHLLARTISQLAPTCFQVPMHCQITLSLPP